MGRTYSLHHTARMSYNIFVCRTRCKEASSKIQKFWDGSTKINFREGALPVNSKEYAGFCAHWMHGDKMMEF
jgi:hypothetical protein